MTLNDLLKAGDLFGAIKSIAPFEFFDDVTPEQLNSLLDLNYGDRKIYSKMMNKTFDQLALDIVTMHNDYWNELIKLELLNIDVESGTTRKLTETIDDLETRKNTRDDINKVSAFNTEELITNDGMTSTGNDTLDGQKTRVLTESNISLKNAYKNLSLLTKHNIISVVIKDVSTFITISIY